MNPYYEDENDIGIDINADYLDLSLSTRLQQPVLDLGSIA